MGKILGAMLLFLSHAKTMHLLRCLPMRSRAFVNQAALQPKKKNHMSPFELCQRCGVGPLQNKSTELSIIHNFQISQPHSSRVFQQCHRYLLLLKAVFHPTSSVPPLTLARFPPAREQQRRRPCAHMRSHVVDDDHVGVAQRGEHGVHVSAEGGGSAHHH